MTRAAKLAVGGREEIGCLTTRVFAWLKPSCTQVPIRVMGDELKVPPTAWPTVLLFLVCPITHEAIVVK